jgi:hypothetical protein
LTFPGRCFIMDSPGTPAHSAKEPGWEFVQKISANTTQGVG